MFSLPKLIILALLLAAVWYGFRWVSRVNHLRAEQAAERSRLRKAAGGAPAAGTAVAEDMEKCPSCGVYVSPRSAAACGRPGCPYG
ncbi:MAG TPA: hypothetical protein VK943_18430 [Arenibaculum sp.]|nr:hypothetical protein [Arenibaculum sp.]